MIKIYKLIYNGEIVYVGQTKKELKVRKSGGYGKNIPFYKDCEIELIEETDDKSRERYWIEKLKDEGHPLMNIKEGNGVDWQEYWKEYRKKYYQENKFRFYNKNKTREEKDEFNAKKRNYYSNNPEAREKNRAYQRNYLKKKKQNNNG